jgi:hypothetical protein
MQLLPMRPSMPPSPIVSTRVHRGMGATMERRRHPRFPTVEDRARLSWADGAGSCEQTAFLVDISRSGARLTSHALIPIETTLKLSLYGGDEYEVDVPGRIVRVGQCAGVGFLIHVEFLKPCPDTLFERAIGWPNCVVLDYDAWVGHAKQKRRA